MRRRFSARRPRKLCAASLVLRGSWPIADPTVFFACCAAGVVYGFVLDVVFQSGSVGILPERAVFESHWTYPVMSRRMSNVPKFAATMASLLLIASAIGVNIARYPIVWQMVGRLDDPQQAVVSSQPATQTVAPTTPPAPAEAIAMPTPSPTPEKSAQTVGFTQTVATTPVPSLPVKPTEPAAPAGLNSDVGTNNGEPTGHIVGVRPMTPVVPADTASMSTASDTGVRRLPPADQVTATATDLMSSADDDAPASYPSTVTP